MRISQFGVSMRRISTMAVTSLLTITLLAAVAARPDVVRHPTAPVILPGSRELTTSHLKTQADRYRTVTRPAPDSAERDLGVRNESVTQTTHNGKPALLLASQSGTGDRTFIDTALVMQEGLHPVWETARFGSRVSRWEYSGKHVQLTFTHPDSGTRTREHTYDIPVFNFNELSILIRSLPMREGFEAILPLYSEGSDELEMDTVRVAARGADGVWPVRFADPAIVATYGIDGATRRVVRYEVSSRRNAAVFRRVPVE